MYPADVSSSPTRATTTRATTTTQQAPAFAHHAAIIQLQHYLNQRIIGQPALILRLLIALLADRAFAG